jgi:Uma2 family endonuclease
MENAVKQVFESPRLYKQLSDLLESEKSQRQYFLGDLSKWEGQKVEFINGEVKIHMPVTKRHADYKRRMMNLLGNYVYSKGLGFVGDEKILISLSRNDYEPDICFFYHHRSQTFKPDQRHFPLPDFVVEILSDSTAHVDRGIKFEDYATHGVQEYWLIDPAQEILEQYFLNSQMVYELQSKREIVESSVIQGFQLPVKAIFFDQDNLEALKGLLS